MQAFTHKRLFLKREFRRLLALFLISGMLASGCVTWNKGLEPLDPSYGYLWNANVDTLRPTLRWKPYDETAGKDDIRYHLELVDNGVIVLSKEDIREPFYAVDRQLEAGKKYEWLVRPVWTSNGFTNWGPWNHKDYVVLTPLIIILFFGVGSHYYTFTTPEQ